MKLKQTIALLLALVLFISSPMSLLSSAKAEEALLLAAKETKKEAEPKDDSTGAGNKINKRLMFVPPPTVEIDLSSSTVSIGSSVNATWSVTGGTNPMIAYANWRIYNADGVIINTITAQNITALSGTTSFKPTSGAKAQFYLHVKDDNNSVGEGYVSKYLTITDDAPIEGSIDLNKSHVDVGESVTATWSITGSSTAKITYAEWVLYDRQGSVVKNYQETGISSTTLSGSRSFTTPSSADVRERAAQGLLRIVVKDSQGREKTIDSARFGINHWEIESGKYYYYRNGQKISGGPHQIGGNLYYFSLDTREMMTGWVKLGSQWYYGETDGKLYRNKWLLENSKYYYFKADGVMARSETVHFPAVGNIPAADHVFDADGVWQGEVEPFNGWFQRDGKWYYNVNGTKKTGWLTIDGKSYWLSPADGSRQSGWVLDKDKYYYMRTDGVMVTGRRIVEGKNHLFAANGVWQGEQSPYTGWEEGDYGGWYYYKANILQTGWLQLGNTWYYLDTAAKTQGLMKTGWQSIGGTWYYFKADGAMVTGWLDLGGTWYYLRGDGSMVTGSMVIDGVNYTFNSSGAMISGDSGTSGNWKQEGGVWYYYQSSVKATGWILDNGSWYYLRSSGAMATGWVQIGSTWYYLKDSGAMATGWAAVGGTWYYLRGDGSMVTGWLQLGSTWYYLRGDGSMVTGTMVIDGVSYTFDSSGAMGGGGASSGTGGWQQEGSTWYYYQGGVKATGWLQVGGTWYYLRSNGAMATGWVQVGSTWYYLKSSGAMATGWLQLGSTWYYLRGDGSMVTGTMVIDGVNNSFNSSGAWLGYI